MATKKLVPRATNEGGLGTALKVWGPSWLQNLTITNLQTTTSLSVLVETAGNVEKRNAGGLCTDVVDTESATTWVGLWDAATGCLMPYTDEALTYNALSNILTIGDSSINTSYYANNVTAKGAPFSLRSTNNTVSLSASLGMHIHDDSDTIQFLTGGTPAQVANLDSTGLFINNIPSEPDPIVNVLVDSVATPGKVSKVAISSFGIDVQDTEDATTFVGLWDSKTGVQLPKTDGGLRYNALDNILKIGAESSNNRIWIRSNLINKFLGNLTVKSQNGHLLLWGNGGKIGIQGFAGSMIATFYTNIGLKLHHLNTESAPTYVLTEGVATGATTTPYSTIGTGFVTKTPITSFVPNLQTLDEGVSLTTTTQSFDFVGAGVTATTVGNAVTVTITGSPSNVLDTEDPTCFISMYESATGALDPKTDEGLLYDALNDHLKVHGALTIGADDTSTTKTIQRAVTTQNAAGGILSLHGGNVVAGAGNDLGGGAVTIWAGAGTGAASAGGSDSYIGFYTYKDVASGSTSQTAQLQATFYADSKNGFRMVGQDSASNFFNVSVDADAETTISTNDNGGTDGHIWMKPDGNLYLEPTTLTTIHGRTSGDSYFKQRQNAANLPGGHFWLMGADAVGNYTGAGTATGGNLNYAAGSGTGTGPNGAHMFWLSKIFDSGNLGVTQLKTLTMAHLTDNDENSLLHLSSLDASPMQLRIQCGQDRARIFTDTAAKTMEIGCKTADGSLIKFQDHTSTVYGDTLATVQSLRIESFMMACSDETTALTTGTAKVKFRMPYAFTVTEVRASLSTAGTGANLVTVDINESGTTILSTKITIDATETTSQTAATAPVISDTALADDAEISIDIDQIDSGGVSAGLKVAIIGYKTV